MNIYTSLKVLPYVYQCIHKTTGKIYIGSRTNKKQKLPSNLDFPKYRTSSNHVKPIFDEFDWHIVAEFFNPKDAYDFEQQLIYEQWQVSKEMSLNKRCDHGKKSWNVIGTSYKHTEETLKKLRKPKSNEHSRKIGESLKGKSKPTRSEEHCKNLSKEKNGMFNKHHTEEAIQNIKRSRRIEHSFLTPDGFVIENTTMKELCSQFNLNYNSISAYFKKNLSYKGFVKLTLQS